MIRYIFAVLLVATLGACGDDEPQLGTVEVNWLHGGPVATCESRNVVNLEATLFSKNEAVIEKTALCESQAKTGVILIEDVPAGRYDIVIEALNQDGKALFRGILEGQQVKSNKVLETQGITLLAKPARIIADWTLPSGKCSSSDIFEVEVSLFYNANDGQPAIDSQRVDCDHTFLHPETGEPTAGVLFEDLEPNQDAVLQALGYNKSNEVVASYLEPSFVVDNGDELDDFVLSLEACEPGACL